MTDPINDAECTVPTSGGLLYADGDQSFVVRSTSTEHLRFCPNGDIYVNGRLAANDAEVVRGMREMLGLRGAERESAALSYTPDHLVVRIERDGYEPTSVAVCRLDTARVIGENVLCAVAAMSRRQDA